MTVLDPMPLQKRLKGAYVCLHCSLKLNKRSFPSALRNESTAATLQSTSPSTLVNQHFRYTLSSAPISERDGGNESPPDVQANPEEDPDSAVPRPGVEKSRKVVTQPRILVSQVEGIAKLSRMTKRLSETSQPTASIEDAVMQVLPRSRAPSKTKVIDTLSKVYTGGTVKDIARDVGTLQQLDQSKHLDEVTQRLVVKLIRGGLLDAPQGSHWHHETLGDESAPKSTGEEQKSQSAATTSSGKRAGRKASTKGLRRQRNEEKLRKKEAAPAAAKAVTAARKSRGRKRAGEESSKSKDKHTFMSTIEATSLSISVLPRTGTSVPNLSHDLSRVLFNPGIYQLQDPRSRVYNFTPYLEKIMPVSEFDFKILKEYITSSRDENLLSLALEHGKKYVGSSSSMTSTLAQFHFLLSQWRALNTEALSRGFSDTLKSFTVIQRSPSSVFLRYQDGIYAMDADKEYDSGNILMSLGKSMEKLLTQKPQEYERYRKTSHVKVPPEERNIPEAYQYTHAGDFLMRAQLDAYDSRLPGTGTFDLKTRAVASIRHNIKQHEEGFGYQIKTRYGDWESYEREYFDMMRSAFLKYSLQVRLGQMDGIFVAFHNVERIFGFQYISLPEMDVTLHGQYDTTLGDEEFKFSVELLNRVLNRVTERFPKRSLRLQFETRDLPAGGIFMQIFAEPMDEASIVAIQTSKKQAIEDFEQRLMNPEMHPQPQDTNDLETMYEQHKDLPDMKATPPTSPSIAESQGSPTSTVESILNEYPAHDDDAAGGFDQPATDGQVYPDKAAEDVPTVETAESPTNTDTTPELLALTLRIQNRVNGKKVERPEHLTSSDHWSLDYSLDEESKEKLARAQYRASKARRKTVLEEREENSVTNYYLRKLREMAAKGAEWRKVQDELDAGRKKTVLYEE